MRLLTGFPGFLGTEFVSRLLQTTESRFLLLIQKKFEDLAMAQVRALNSRIRGAESRIEIVFGDITLPDLGIKNDPRLTQITEVDHFAAVYDLNVRKDLAKKVNVDGTRNVLEFISRLPSFHCLHYVSTCYVSGRWNGRFMESDLERGQDFNNHYESTKYEAEVLVRSAMNSGMPAVIYRPAIVVGDSRTGETRKYDGPYFVLQWLLRQGTYAILPEIGNPRDFTINLVPSDFVLDAMAFLARQESSIGNTFQLADPSPLTIQEVVESFSHVLKKHLLRIPLPKSLAKAALAGIPGLEAWLGIPRSSLDYFVHPTSYDVSQTMRALRGSGIQCPLFSSYVKTLVDYRVKNPDLRTKAMI
ncbi:MAG: SDR family oxidoreductase [Bdellovibrionales bacterium]|nr:SDR family oxidoreductase [Bdellovibrionales bacterium]